MKKTILPSGVFIALISILFTQGCSVTSTAESASAAIGNSKNICVVENSDVRPEFLSSYKSLLVKKGFKVSVLPPNSDIKACKFSSTYIGRWSWDLKPYMASAEIKVYKEGKEVGNALYKAPSAGWSMTLKIYEKTETKIKGMVDNLFPGK